MAQKLYDLVVKTGSYTDQSGQEKGRFMNVGAVMKGDNGSFIMLNKTFNPAGVPDLNGRGGDSVLISMYEPRQNDRPSPSNQPQQQPQPASQQAGPDYGGGTAADDIPFAQHQRGAII